MSARVQVRADLVVATLVALTTILAVIPVSASWDLYAVRFVALAISVSGWLAAAFVPGVYRAPTRKDWPFLLTLVAFTLIAVTSTAFSYAPAELLTFGAGYYMGAATWVMLAVLTAAASLVVPRDGLRRGLLGAMVPLGAVGLYALGQAVAGSDRVTSTFENSNHLVPGLLIGAPVALGLAMSTRGAARFWLAFASASIWLGAALSGSTAALLGASAAAAVGLMAFPRLFGVPTAKAGLARRATAASVTVGVLVVVALAVAGATPIGREVRGVFSDASHTDRLFMWKTALGVTAEHPLLGVGADAYEVAGQRRMQGASVTMLQIATEQAPVAPDPHSMPIDVLVSFGLLGFAAFSAASVAWGRTMWDQLRSKGGMQRGSFALGVLGWAVAMLVLPVSVQWGGFVAMMLGLAIAQRGEVGVGVGRPWRPAVPALAVALAFAFAVLGVSAGVGAYWYHRAVVVESDAGYWKAMGNAVKAQPTMSFYRFMVLDSRGRDLGLTDADAKRFQSDVDAAGPAVTADVRFMVMLVRDSLDQAYRSGRKDLAWEEERLAQITSVAPGLPEVLMENAHLALLKGEPERAMESLLAAQPYSPALRRTNLYRYYYSLARGRADAAARLRPLVERDELLAPLLQPAAVKKP